MGTWEGPRPPPATDSARQSRASSTRLAADTAAVIVLDRAVTRVLGSGATMTLTHEIVRVDSKDAINRWGENRGPGRRRDPDLAHPQVRRDDARARGDRREGDRLGGRSAIGDYVEWELLETHGPSEAFAPGFLADALLFSIVRRSDRAQRARAGDSAGLLVGGRCPGRRAQGGERQGAEGARITTFVATNVPQLFAERSAVPAIEYVPSVRVSSGVGWNAWARYLTEELHDAVRVSPAVAALAKKNRGARRRRSCRGSPPRLSTGSPRTSRRPTSWPSPPGTRWHGAAAAGWR